jgi:predicted CXXCH cytochrome family protein
MEVCMQCHLETTSFPLPNSLLRFGRGAFSYRPGEPLYGFVLHFDHSPAAGHGDKFEIVNSVYRLRQSPCFKRSPALQCTTCHDPHSIPRGPAAAAVYSKACRQCHGTPLDVLVSKGRHPEAAECVSCHMPKRRAEDVVHAVMTDHRIQRQPPRGNPLAALAERHETPGKPGAGEVVLYYPPGLADSPENDLYLALAQVVQRSNLAAGIPRLAGAIEKHRPWIERHCQPRFHFGLAQAYTATGEGDRAAGAYREALRLEADFVPALRNLGELLVATGRAEEAVTILERARKLEPRNAGVLQALGQAYRDVNRLDDARTALESAVSHDPDSPEAHNSLGNVLLEKNDIPGARAALREAIRQQPDFAQAHSNLGNALVASGDLTLAQQHYATAASLAPRSAHAHYSLGAALMKMERLAEARREMEAAVRLEPELAEAQEALGSLYSADGDWGRATRHYRLALRLRPEFDRAHLGLGSALAASGDAPGARGHLQKAAASTDPGIRREAAEVLGMIGDGRGR